MSCTCLGYLGNNQTNTCTISDSSKPSTKMVQIADILRCWNKPASATQDTQLNTDCSQEKAQFRPNQTRNCFRFLRLCLPWPVFDQSTVNDNVLLLQRYKSSSKTPNSQPAWLNVGLKTWMKFKYYPTHCQVWLSWCLIKHCRCTYCWSKRILNHIKMKYTEYAFSKRHSNSEYPFAMIYLLYTTGSGGLEVSAAGSWLWGLEFTACDHQSFSKTLLL